MPYLTFILVNVILFIRPAEIVPALIGLPLYNVVVVLSLVATFPAVLGQLTPKSLSERPVTVCVLGLLTAVVLADLSRMLPGQALASGNEFSRICLYYLLLVGALDTFDRLRGFLSWLAAIILGLTLISLAQYYGVIDVPALAACRQGQYNKDGEFTGFILRLCSTGIYNNPNAMARIAVTGVFLCAFQIEDTRSGLFRWAWSVPLGILGFALLLTHSRGGFLGLLVGMAALFHARFGLKKAIFAGTLVFPVVLVVFGGRQTELSTGEDTAQERIRLWREGWQYFQEAPAFGIGVNNFVDRAGLVAHNSYLHCFSELGFFGGSLFVGAFFFALRSLYALGGEMASERDAGIVKMRAYLIAVIAADAAGMLSISRAYHPPTYMLLGLATAYARSFAADRPHLAPRFNARSLGVIAAVGLAALSAIYLFIRVTVH